MEASAAAASLTLEVTPIGLKRRLRQAVARMLYEPRTDPVVVLGNQKTGTSAIAHLLADHGGLSKTIDVPELWYPTLAGLLRGELDLAVVVRANPKPFAAELLKEPNLTFMYPAVRRVFPGARYVFVNRAPGQNIRSILNRMRLPGNLDDLAQGSWKIPASWAPAFDPTVFETGSTHYVDMLADRWNRAADVYLEHRDEMVAVRYEDFVRDKVGTVAALARELGLPARRDVSDVADVQYQPRGDRAVSLEEFFGPRNLLRIERICGSRARACGYQG